MSSGKKMKICHVITRMIVGGAQENTLYTILGHLRRGHEVVLSPARHRGGRGNCCRTSIFRRSKRSSCRAWSASSTRPTT